MLPATSNIAFKETVSLPLSKETCGFLVAPLDSLFSLLQEKFTEHPDRFIPTPRAPLSEANAIYTANSELK